MAEELIPKVKRIYEALSRWDIEEFSHSVAHDFELNLPESVPFGGTRHGYDGMEAMARIYEDHIEGAWADPEHYFDAGDALVTVGRLRGKGKKTGRSFEVEFADVWTFTDGSPSRCRAHFDTAPITAAIETADAT